MFSTIIIYIKLGLVFYLNFNLSIASSVSDTFFTFSNQGQSVAIPIYTNNSKINSDKIHRVVIIVHGITEDAKGAYSTLYRLIGQYNDDINNTIIIAPQFLTSGDLAKYDLPKSVLGWGIRDWSEGKSSIKYNLSSFKVIDKIIENAISKYPNAKIMVTGFSAGAQFVQRYAVLGDFPNKTNFLIIAPSSYLYVSPDRYNELNKLYVPDNKTCRYNDYRYGLDNLPSYLSKNISLKVIRYSSLSITYVVGGADNEPDFMLDSNCAANIQGTNRMLRAKNYLNYLNAHFMNSKSQNLVIVDNVGHEQAKMLASKEVSKILFQ